MESRIKSILTIGIILIILLVAFVYYQQSVKEAVAPAEENWKSSTQQIEPPKATANVDAMVDAAIQGLAAESDLVSDEDKDSSLIGADSQAINDFGQSYDEKEF